MNTKVEIYTKNSCVYCQRAKDLLRIKGVPFVEHDITENDFKALEMQRRGQWQVVPGIFIDNDLIGGCLELFTLDEQGDLDALLGLTTPSGELFP